MSHMLVRVDSSSQIGMGHLMRCIALAQSWKVNGGETTFITSCSSEKLEGRLSREGFTVVTLERSHPDPEDWETTSEVLASNSGSWVVIDGYHFDSAYQLLIKESEHPLLVIDDEAHLDHYYADVVLNQNPNAVDLKYSTDPSTVMLLGSKYALLRQEFLRLRHRKERHFPRVARNILITLGGGDPNNVTLKVLRALKQLETEELSIAIIVGNNNPNGDIIESEILDLQPNTQLLSGVTDIERWMDWADITVSAAGSTCWELCFMGVPAVTIETAGNQRGLAGNVHAIGATENIGWHSELSPNQIAEAVWGLATSVERRMQMANLGSELVDGQGSDRVTTQLAGRRLRMRSAIDQDAALVWEWSNDLDVRENSFSPGRISWERHERWFRSKLADRNSRLYIAVNNDDEKEIGQIRFDMTQSVLVTGIASIADDITVNVSVESQHRNKGYGTEMIKLASVRICRELGPRNIHAYVLPDNVASLEAFEKSGYQTLGETTVRGKRCIELVKPKMIDVS